LFCFKYIFLVCAARNAALLSKSGLLVASAALIRRAQPNNTPTLVWVQKLTSNSDMDGRRNR
jgi:hypothetical protein